MLICVRVTEHAAVPVSFARAKQPELKSLTQCFLEDREWTVLARPKGFHSRVSRKKRLLILLYLVLYLKFSPKKLESSLTVVCNKYIKCSIKQINDMNQKTKNEDK